MLYDFITKYTDIFCWKKWEKLLHCKSFSHFSNKKYWQISNIHMWNLNEILTNDVVSSEQPGPGLLTKRLHFKKRKLLLEEKSFPFRADPYGKGCWKEKKCWEIFLKVYAITVILFVRSILVLSTLLPLNRKITLPFVNSNAPGALDRIYSESVLDVGVCFFKRCYHLT